MTQSDTFAVIAIKIKREQDTEKISKRLEKENNSLSINVTHRKNRTNFHSNKIENTYTSKFLPQPYPKPQSADYNLHLVHRNHKRKA